MVKYSGQRAKLTNYQQRNAYAEGLLDLVIKNQESAAASDRNIAALAVQQQANEKERKAQEELFANQQFQRAEQDAAAIYKVDLGSNKTNQNFHDYLFGMKEQSYKIRTLQREGKISSSEAAQAIAELNQKVQGTMDEAVAVTVQADALRKGLEIPPGQPGAISSRTPNGVQQALLGMKTGESKYVRRNNVTYAVRENPNDPNNPYVANLTQIAKDSADGKDAFNTVPDLSETYKNAYNNVVKPGGKDNADLVTFEEKRVGSEMATVKFMTPQQRAKAISSMVNAGQFNGLLDDEQRMKTVWADLMGKDTDWMNVEGNSPQEIEANIQKQRKEAATFLATKALEDNAPADGVKMLVKSRKYSAPGSSKGSQKPPSLADQRFSAKQAIYEDYVSKSHELVNDYDKIAEALTEVNPVDGTYTVVDDQYVIDSMDDELYDKYAEADEAEKKKILKDAAGKIKVTIGETIVDEDGNTVAGLNSASGIKKALTKVHGISAEDQKIFDTRISERERRVKAEAQQAYDALEEKPAEDKEYFEYEGKRYKNPNWVSERKDFDPNVGDGTKNNPNQGVAKVSQAVEGQYYVNNIDGSPDKGKVYQFKNGKYVEVK
mgnify:CR=1 FL=1